MPKPLLYTPPRKQSSQYRNPNAKPHNSGNAPQTSQRPPKRPLNKPESSKTHDNNLPQWIPLLPTHPPHNKPSPPLPTPTTQKPPTISIPSSFPPPSAEPFPPRPSTHPTRHNAFPSSQPYPPTPVEIRQMPREKSFTRTISRNYEERCATTSLDFSCGVEPEEVGWGFAGGATSTTRPKVILGNN